MKPRPRPRPKKSRLPEGARGTVVFFDENLGYGLLRLDSGERVRFTHRDLAEAEGFQVMFEGERVEIRQGTIHRLTPPEP